MRKHSKEHVSDRFIRLTGTAVPLGALRTEESCGCGEYTDLMLFADFCKKSGLGIIQLLPVNDTGTDSSPYNALSAFALHPLYINIARLPEFEKSPVFKIKLDEIKKRHECKKRFSYTELRYDKLALLREMYEANAEILLHDVELGHWLSENSWVSAYAVFMRLKIIHMEASWKSWEQKYQSLSERALQDMWNDADLRREHFFYVWMQYRAAQQFSQAAAYIREKGIILKGDVPIMMNEDSCDTWAYPSFFNEELRAGSPPDGMNPEGQNWGFPIYRWNNLKKDNYSWWKERLKQAAKYYEAFRIDHVLGFFRIWATPACEVSAQMGRPEPDVPIKLDELKEAGFSEDRIRWLCEPHVPTRAVEEVNNNDYLGTHGLLHMVMDRIGNEELWLFKKNIQGERDIYDTDLPQPIKEKLACFWRDRALRKTAKNKYSVMWGYENSSAWKTLSEREQSALRKLITASEQEKEKKWEKQAKVILGELTSATPMVACAEDLGANPLSVPRVLDSLSVLGLRVVRWTREWEKEGQPFIRFEDYPPLSVAASSVHDSSTLRLWWLNEPDAAGFCRDFSCPPDIKAGEFTSRTASYVLEQIAGVASMFCIHPIQDFLSLSDICYEPDPLEERVNIPGQVLPFNWTYRLPVPIETLLEDGVLVQSIQRIVLIHEKNGGNVEGGSI